MRADRTLLRIAVCLGVACAPPADKPRKDPQPCADRDEDQVCDDDDVCEGDDAAGDEDADGVCDDLDQCDGDDATGDTDEDGICDDIDVCMGRDHMGDDDGDGICDDQDRCFGDNSTGDVDSDAVCGDLDPCPNIRGACFLVEGQLTGQAEGTELSKFVGTDLAAELGGVRVTCQAGYNPLEGTVEEFLADDLQAPLVTGTAPLASLGLQGPTWSFYSRETTWGGSGASITYREPEWNCPGTVRMIRVSGQLPDDRFRCEWPAGTFHMPALVAVSQSDVDANCAGIPGTTHRVEGPGSITYQLPYQFSR